MSDKPDNETPQNEEVRATNADSALSPNLTSYLKSFGAIWYWLTITTASITMIVVFSIPESAYPWVYLRNILGILLVLWLPGYALTRLLFLHRTPLKASKEQIDQIERITLSIGLSIAIIPLVGLLLNYLPWGIRLIPIVLTLLTFTVAVATAGVIREYLATSKTQT